MKRKRLQEASRGLVSQERYQNIAYSFFCSVEKGSRTGSFVQEDDVKQDCGEGSGDMVGKGRCGCTNPSSFVFGE